MAIFKSAVFMVCTLAVATATQTVSARLFKCHEMLDAGPKLVELDRTYLIKTRMMRDLDDDADFSISELIRSSTTRMDFTRNGLIDGRFQVSMNDLPNDVTGLTAWVSDRERDGVCAIELEGWRGGRLVQEYMQILAIYPGGTLALGLPNTQNRVGLILLGDVERAGGNAHRDVSMSIFDL